MKIAKIVAMNLLGARSIELETRQPIQLIAGKNRQGKSSIANAVRLALCADFGRVSQKKDLPELITEGADNAVAQVIDADGDEYTVTIMRSGKVKDSHKGREHDPRLPFVLDAQRIARLSTTERRTFLSGLLGISFDDKKVVELLLARGLDADRVKRLVPLLKAGTDTAMVSAKERAAEARGQWREITGENYGTVKAATWSAPVPAFNPAELAEMQQALAVSEQSLGEAQQILGTLEERDRAAKAAAGQRAALSQVASMLERRRTKLATDKAELQTWQQNLAAAEAAAGNGPRSGLVHDLAKLVSVGVFTGEHEQQAVQALDAYEALHGPIDATDGDPAEAARLPEIRRSLELMTRAVSNSERDVRASEDAAAQLEALKAAGAEAVDPEELRAAKEGVQALEGLKTTRANRVRELLTAQRDLNSSEQRTRDARAAHDSVTAWDAIAAALSPDGVQAELLAAALAPLNDRLEQSALDLGWPRVAIDTDMRITADGRAYHLLSVSEQWRVDAMLAEAASNISGLLVLLLDGMDVLDADSRPALINWLNVLAETGEVATAIVCATLRALPADLPPTFDAHWVQDGYCGVVAEAA